MHCPLPTHIFHYASIALARQWLGRVGELQQCPLVPGTRGRGGPARGRLARDACQQDARGPVVAVDREAQAHF